MVNFEKSNKFDKIFFYVIYSFWIIIKREEKICQEKRKKLEVADLQQLD